MLLVASAIIAYVILLLFTSTTFRNAVETVLDWLLTRLFRFIAPWAKKCSRCTVKARVAQIGLVVTTPAAFALRTPRLRWEYAAHPERPALVPIRFEDL